MKTTIPQDVREKVFHAALLRMNQIDVPLYAGCLYWTMFGCEALHRITGVLALPQAGSCFWPRYHRGQRDDDFGYGYLDYADESMRPTYVGSKLPEMHCWLAINDDPEDPVFIDFSAGMLVTAYRKLAMKRLGGGRDWTCRHPPSFLWNRVSEMPEDVVYNVHPGAVETMMKAAVEERIIPKCFVDYLKSLTTKGSVQ